LFTGWSAAHRTFFEKQLKLTAFVLTRAKNFGLCEQKQLKLTVLVQPPRSSNKSNSDCLHFVPPCSDNLRKLRTKEAQNDCSLYVPEKQLKPTAFLFCPSYGICEQKQLQLTVFCEALPKILDLPTKAEITTPLREENGGGVWWSPPPL
jgi:hypothetical protein